MSNARVGLGPRGRGKGTAMARQVQTRLIDDLDGSEAAGTARFGYEGVEYEVDLSDQHLEEFEEFLAPYIEHGHRVRGDRRGRRRAGRDGQRKERDLGAVRRWAREQGYQVSDRGRIAGDILARYDETH